MKMIHNLGPVGQPTESAKGWSHGVTNALVVVATIVLASLGFEIASRFFLDPLDFLAPSLIRDRNLGYRIAPYSGGHDAWGFRNRSVPDRADIVAIGDSMTYGMSAPASHSWPAALATLSGITTYNLGVSGYGPIEYAKLLSTQAARLSPRVVVIGLFLGNDIRDAYLSEIGQTDPQIEIALEPRGPFEQLRRWMGGHSMLYGLTKAALPQLTARIRGRVNDQRVADGVVEVQLWGKPIGLTPRFLLRTLDIGESQIAAGFAQTVAEIQSMIGSCRQHNLGCYFLVLPTKESVLEPMVAGILPVPELDLLQAVVSKEATLTTSLKNAVTDSDFQVIEPLENLRNEARQHAVYDATDNHPNALGYEVIARSVWAAIKDDPRLAMAKK